MNKKDIKQKLDSIIANSQYVRVSEDHPLELYLGKNEKGAFTLRYNGSFKPIKIIGNGVLEVKQVKTSSYNSLMFCYNSDDNLSLFCSFCEDIINETINYHGEDGYLEIANRYNQWKKMFYGGNKVLSENEALGLIGELMFLKNYVLVSYDATTGLNGWSGPEPTHKDFSYKNAWFEIKSINSYKSTVTISSIEQLDSETNGRLVIYLFEKMSQSFNGISLNSLVCDVTNMLKYDSEKDIFFWKLKQAGYAYNEIYDSYVYNLVSVEKYIVDSTFPRLKAENLPDGIGKVQYEILLSAIEKYKEA